MCAVIQLLIFIAYSFLFSFVFFLVITCSYRLFICLWCPVLFLSFGLFGFFMFISKGIQG